MFINLTTCNINIVSGNTTRTIIKSGQVARVSVKRELTHKLLGVPIYEQKYGDVVGLPKRKEGVFLIVSGAVLSALDGSRPDVYAPIDLLINENGQGVDTIGLTKQRQ